MISLETVWPPFGVTLRQGDLELRVVRDEDLSALISLVLDGVHDPDQMPFSEPWTRLPPSELPGSYAGFHWRSRAQCRPDDFVLEFVVRAGGTVVGCQGLRASDFAVTRTASTGSWLGRRFHGHGIGTRMRQAVCAFAFDVLGARSLTSEAFADNVASHLVSERLGYRANGERTVAREGQAALQHQFVLDPADFRRATDPLQVGGAEPLLHYLGLDVAHRSGLTE